ncbi:hypothetical protein [uncultured Bartonella sp.]|uniref:hypothetical protein n=1 Tax=uncultured Bartonella sp. TaxID=104108 RepID=UPI00262C0FC0|nr:hypothetical protein [uncultured Bartonella sp.]
MSPHILRLKEKYSATSVTPVWLLIYRRLVNEHPDMDYAGAYLRLKERLRRNVKMPTVDEVGVNLALHKLI